MSKKTLYWDIMKTWAPAFNTYAKNICTNKMDYVRYKKAAYNNINRISEYRVKPNNHGKNKIQAK